MWSLQVLLLCGFFTPSYWSFRTKSSGNVLPAAEWSFLHRRHAGVLHRGPVERPHHLMHTDACSSVGGGYHLHGQSYGQFKWTPREKYTFGATGLKPVNKTDIRILEFATAVTAIYTERERLRNSCLELRIDNSGAWKWLTTRKMNHLWGHGWMCLLDSVCCAYGIEIKPVCISGAENPVADALSRYKIQEINGVDLSVLRGASRMNCPDFKWREKVWMKGKKKRYGENC